jgi:hypothetical protein
VLDLHYAIWFKISSKNTIVRGNIKKSSIMDYISNNINRNELLMRKRTAGVD